MSPVLFENDKATEWDSNIRVPESYRLTEDSASLCVALLHRLESLRQRKHRDLIANFIMVDLIQ